MYSSSLLPRLHVLLGSQLLFFGVNHPLHRLYGCSVCSPGDRSSSTTSLPLRAPAFSSHNRPILLGGFLTHSCGYLATSATPQASQTLGAPFRTSPFSDCFDRSRRLLHARVPNFRQCSLLALIRFCASTPFRVFYGLWSSQSLSRTPES